MLVFFRNLTGKLSVMGKMKAGILGFRVLECYNLLGIGKNSIHGRVASTIPTRRVCAFAVRVSMQRHHMLCRLMSIVAKELLNGQRVVVVQRWRFPACCERRIIFPAVLVAKPKPSPLYLLWFSSSVQLQH